MTDLARTALASLAFLVLAGCSTPQAVGPEPKAARPLPRADAPSPQASAEPIEHRMALGVFEIVTSLRCTFGESSRFDFEAGRRLDLK